MANNLQKKCVVTISWAKEREDQVPQHWLQADSDMRHLMSELDCVVVNAAGNDREDDGTNSDINGYPGVFQRDTMPIINVGNVDISGTFSPTSQRGPQLTVSLVGNPVLCQEDSNSNTGREGRGTSFGKFTSDASRKHC